jgi:hypothetical protein
VDKLIERKKGGPTEAAKEGILMLAEASLALEG